MSERRRFWMTVTAVIFTGALSFTAAALYDTYVGGPEARKASVDTEQILDQIQQQQLRAECALTYSYADTTSHAVLLTALGEVVLDYIETGEISNQLVRNLHDATTQRRLYLTLNSQVNELCDPARTGGPQPLTPEQQPKIDYGD